MSETWRATQEFSGNSGNGCLRNAESKVSMQPIQEEEKLFTLVVVLNFEFTVVMYYI